MGVSPAPRTVPFEGRAIAAQLAKSTAGVTLFFSSPEFTRDEIVTLRQVSQAKIEGLCVVAYYSGHAHRLIDFLALGGLASFGFILPSLWLDRRIARRSKLLRRSMPDFLDLMIVCLESGLSMQGSVQRVGEEISIAHPHVARELAAVQSDIALGASIDGAFSKFADRTGLDFIRAMSTFIRESRRLGTEIVGALRAHADSMRYEREQKAEELAQKASVKILFPMLLLILPAVFVGDGTHDLRIVAGSVRFVAVLGLTIIPSQLLSPAYDVYLVE